MDNFQCQECDSTFFVPRYRIIFKGEDTIYMEKTQQIKCNSCESLNIKPIPKEGNVNASYGKFSSSNEEGKRRILKKRADKMKKKTEEQYDTINRDFKGITDPKFY